MTESNETNTNWWDNGLSRRNVIRGGLLGGAGLAAAALIGCGDDDDDDSSSANQPEGLSKAAAEDATANGVLTAPGTPQYGGKAVTAFWGRLGNLDIHHGGHRGIMSQAFDSVVRLNPLDGLTTTIPGLATSWEMSPDGLTYTWNIRQGVQFHDGETLTSEDVAMSHRKIMAQGEFTTDNYEGFPSRLAGPLDMCIDNQAVDASTVVSTLKHPRGYFLEMMAGPAKGIYNQKTVKGDELDLSQNAAPGTGPYVFVEHRTEELTRFKANPNYWNPALPYLDELEMLHVVQWADRATAILGGQVDYANIVPAEFYDRKEEFADTAGVARHDGTRASLSFYINNEKAPFNDERVRRAMFLAPNRPALIDVYPESMQLAGSRWVSNSSPVATPLDEIKKISGYKGEDEDAIDEANKLMAAAGHGGGLSGISIVTNTNQSHSEILAPAFQAELKKKLNIDTNVDPRSGGGRTEALNDPNMDIVLTVHFRASASEFVTAWKDSIRTGGYRNFGGYSNPEVDSLIDKIDAELDFEAKKEMYNQTMDILDQTVPMYVVAFTQHNAMWSNRLKGHLEETRQFTEEGTWDLFNIG